MAAAAVGRSPPAIVRARMNSSPTLLAMRTHRQTSVERRTRARADSTSGASAGSTNRSRMWPPMSAARAASPSQCTSAATRSLALTAEPIAIWLIGAHGASRRQRGGRARPTRYRGCVGPRIP